MVAKLLLNLEEGMQKTLLHNQSSGLAACAKQIINLAGIKIPAKKHWLISSYAINRFYFR